MLENEVQISCYPICKITFQTRRWGTTKNLKLYLFLWLKNLQDVFTDLFSNFISLEFDFDFKSDMWR